MKIIVYYLAFPILIVGQFSSVQYGLGLDIGSSGSGIFFNHMWTNTSETASIVAELRYFDVKGDEETIVYDYWTNQYSTVGGQNLILLPMLLGGNYYPFAGMIANNFSPFVTLRSGPIFTIDGKETRGNFHERWSESQTHWSFGGFIGLGLEFKWVNLSSVILHVGADILPLSQKADDKDDYSGMLIHIAFNRFRK